MSRRRDARVRRLDNALRRKLKWYRSRARRLQPGPVLRAVSDRRRRLNMWALRRAAFSGWTL